MQRFNIKNESVETVFDYDITPEECLNLSKLGIDDRAEYLKVNDDTKRLHLALLFKLRGDVIKSLELVVKLPDPLKLEYMNSITSAL